MKSPRQLNRIHDDFWCKLDKNDAGIRQSLREPIRKIARQFKAAVFDELGDFPARNNANADFTFFVFGDK